MKKTLLCVVLFLMSTGVSAQALWRGVAVGATPAQVRSLIPEARDSSSEAQTAEPGRLLEIDAHELAGSPFQVSFIFEADRLKRVRLLSDAGGAQEARALGQRLTTSLRSLYGLEMSTRSRGSTSSITIDRQWNFRRTVIHLQVLDVQFVSVEYSGQTPVRANPP
jgi:hypothetical protein